MSAQTKGVDVLANIRELFCYHDEKCQRVNERVEALNAIAKLIDASRRTVAAFEALGKSSGVVQTMEAHRECEAALVAQKKALARIGGAK